MSANVIPLTGRAMAKPTTAQDMAMLQAHQKAENALSMALHYLRTGKGEEGLRNACLHLCKAEIAMNTLCQLKDAGAGARVQISGGV